MVHHCRTHPAGGFEHRSCERLRSCPRRGVTQFLERALSRIPQAMVKNPPRLVLTGKAHLKEVSRIIPSDVGHLRGERSPGRVWLRLLVAGFPLLAADGQGLLVLRYVRSLLRPFDVA